MAQLGFAYRPVAGLASAVHYHQLPQPGGTLQLQADIERCDAEAVAYSGKAFIDGRLALELVDSVGPMLPMDEFDEPEAVRADFHTLLGAGATPGRFGGVPLPELQDLQVEPGERLGAMLLVPEAADAPYFADHFPRRPVFPGTLLMDALASLSVQLVQRSGPLGGHGELGHTKGQPGEDPLVHRARRAAAARSAAAGRRCAARPAQGHGAQRGQDRGHGPHRGHAQEPGMSSRRRVAITGLGLVTPVGNDVASTWAALLAGRSGGARASPASMPAAFPMRIAAEVKGLDDAAVLQALRGERKLLKFANRSHRFALVAAAQAFADAGIRPTEATATRWGCVVGTGMMGVTYDELAEVQREAAPDGELDPAKLLARARLGRRPDGLLPQQFQRRRGAVDAGLRHPRLFQLGAHRLRLGRPGGGHGTQAASAAARPIACWQAASIR